MRILYEVIDPHTDVAMLRSRFQPLAASRGMDWKMRDTEERERVLLMVSKFDHCLGDLLYRVRIGELKMDIVAIVSNHPREALSLGMINRSEEHTSELQSLMRISYAVFCLKKKMKNNTKT